MTAETILQHIPGEYSDLQIEASLIKVFLQQKDLLCDDPIPELSEILANAETEICAIADEKSSGDLSLELIENVFESLVDEKEKRESGVVFTPRYIVDYIVRNTLDGHFNENDHIIDPACGSGAFLVLAAEHISQTTRRTVGQTISQNIYGIDISEDHVRRSKELLMLLALSHGEDLSAVSFNIKAADSLKVDWNALFDVENFEFIIGNPPYVNTHDMTKETIAYLRGSFATTQKGIFNIFYAFIERSMKFLSDGGMFGFIVPNNYLTITAAEGLRKYLAENRYLSKIVDFGENMVFAPVRTYNSLLFLARNNHDLFEYATVGKTDDIKTSLETLLFLSMSAADLDSAGWNLLGAVERRNIKKIEQAGKPIKSYIRVGIATLKDEIYLLDGVDQASGMYYKLFDGERYLVEPEVTREIYKISNIKAESSLLDAKQHIIFPYIEVRQSSFPDTANSIYQIIPEDILSDRYPLCYQYLCRCRSILDKRDKGRGNPVTWYAYGRTQGLRNNRRKLLFPTFSLHPKFMLENSRTTLYCNGYAVLESDEYGLEILQKVLNSAVMDYYISKTSYSIEGNYKCYQKKYIQNFSIPSFNDSEIEYLSSTDDRTAIDDFLISKYRLDF